MNRIPTGTTGSYRTRPCVALDIRHPHHADLQLLKFPNIDGKNSVGWHPDSEDNSWGIESDPGATYLWIHPNDGNFMKDRSFMDGYHCVSCHNYNQWAEANLTQNRHICYSCRSVYAWKYADQFLE